MTSNNNSKSINATKTLTLRPSQAPIAIKHMVKVNLMNAEAGKDRRPLFMWGPPGIAKSSIMRQVAKELNYKLIDIRLSQMDPTDLRGIPVPFRNGDPGAEEAVVQWAIPKLLPRCDVGKRTATIEKSIFYRESEDDTHYEGAIILLDELPNAVPSVQAGSYELVLDGRLGEYTLPTNVVVFAAGNEETDKAGTFKMPTPLRNRFDHVKLEVSYEDWANYAVMSGFHRDVVGYLEAFKHELFEFNPTSASKAFATPRSWEMVSDILLADSNLPEDIELLLVSGAVGDGIGLKFTTYRKNTAKLPNPTDILDGKIKKLDDKLDISILYSLVTALSYELRNRYEAVKYAVDKKTENEEEKKFSKAADNFFGFAMENFQPELVIMATKQVLGKFRIKFSPTLVNNWNVFREKYKSLLVGK